MRDWDHPQDMTTMLLRDYIREKDRSHDTDNTYWYSDFRTLAGRIGLAMQAYDEHHALLASQPPTRTRARR